MTARHIIIFMVLLIASGILHSFLQGDDPWPYIQAINIWFAAIMIVWAVEDIHHGKH